jgi:hypothetical protein
MDFESLECLKYFAALSQGDPHQSIFHFQSKMGIPTDDAATVQFNFKKANWAVRRAELVAIDVEELAQIVSETIPVYKRDRKGFEKDIGACLRRKPPDLVGAQMYQSAIDGLWERLLQRGLSVPHGYKDLGHFLQYNTGSKLPSMKVAAFYGGKVGQQLKALSDYHQVFHTELNDAHSRVKWEHLFDSALLTVQEKSMRKHDRRYKQYKFDKSGNSSLLLKPANHPDREHAKEILKLAKAMTEDETVPLAHQSMLKDHLAYLERYRFDPGALFVDYVETLKSRPQVSDRETE